jgi:hypothetical protein
MRSLFSFSRPLVFALCGCLPLLAGIPKPKQEVQKSSTEYANLPINSRSLQQSIQQSELIARGRVIAHTPAGLNGEHHSDATSTSISITETYFGPLKPGNKVDYFCVCHQEGSSDLIGRDVIVFLDYNKPMHMWEPAAPNYQLFFHDDLKTRILRALKERH